MSDLIVSGNCPKCGTVNQREVQRLLNTASRSRYAALALKSDVKCRYCGTSFSIATTISAKLSEILIIVIGLMVVPVLLILALIIWKNFFF